MIQFEKNENDIHLLSILKSWEYILKVDGENIFTYKRYRNSVIKRQMFYFLAKMMTKNSYVQIIEFLHNRYNFKQTHGNLVHAVKTIMDISTYDKELRGNILRMQNELYFKNSLSICVVDVDLLSICLDNTKLYNYES